MSFADDQEEERRLAIENARARIAHGKHFPARDLAENIAIVRDMLLKEYGTLADAIDALDAISEQEKGPVMMARRFGTRLLEVALINPEALRRVAEAFSQLADDGAQDPRAERIISAYEDCPFPPTFAELKRAFIERFGDNRWPADFAVRKTLQSLDLPLGTATLGRPPGSKNKI
jgi:hypothetical protein